jgi:hypothetical protein
MIQHLSESEFTEYLLGNASSTTHAHLRECDACRQELEAFGGALTAFNQASLIYSREQVAARPIDSQAMAANTPRRTHHAGLLAVTATRWGVGVAAAAVLAAAAALPMLLHRPAAGPAIATRIAAPAPQTAAPDSAAQINEDNQMMAEIESEISQPDVSPLESFTTIRPSTLEHQTVRKKL